MGVEHIVAIKGRRVRKTDPGIVPVGADELVGVADITVERGNLRLRSREANLAERDSSLRISSDGDKGVVVEPHLLNVGPVTPETVVLTTCAVLEARYVAAGAHSSTGIIK